MGLISRLVCSSQLRAMIVSDLVGNFLNETAGLRIFLRAACAYLRLGIAQEHSTTLLNA